jgi:putative aminopeptidase FrvX
VKNLLMGRRGSRAGFLAPLVLASLLYSTWAPPFCQAQDPESVAALATRLVALPAVTGYEQALADTLLRLLPGAARDRAGNVRFHNRQGSAKRLLVCPLDEPGYVVGNLRADGYLTLRRAPGRVAALFDQQIEGQRVTIHGSRRPVPGVVAVRSIHLTRGRAGRPEEPFTVDDAYVDVGAGSLTDLTRLGIKVLAPVTLTKRPHSYGNNLLAAPVAGRRAACAALLAATRESTLRANLMAPVTIAFVVEQQLSRRGLITLANADGPFIETLIVDGRAGELGSLQKTVAQDTSGGSRKLGRVLEWSLPVRYAGTAVETVSLRDADSLSQELVRWIAEQ